MNADTVESAVVEPIAPVVPPEPPSLSVQDHAAVYGPSAKDDPDAPAGETQAEKAERLHHSAEQKRAKTGEFAPGKVRHRAESQKATPQDVPRIRELSAKNSELTKQLEAAQRELAAAKASGSASQVAKAEAKVERVEAKAETAAFSEPEPQEDDPKFAGDYGKYLRAAAAWEGRKAYHDEKAAERAAVVRAEKDAAARETVKTWAGRVESAKTKYPDFEAVAFGPTRIREGSAIDAFVMEDELGADVLYHLNKHPEEIDRLSAMSEVKQLRELVALATSLSPNASAAGTTTAAPARKPIVLLPTPPTVVRTEAQRASEGPPPTDGSLSLAEHRKAFGPKARR